MSESNTNRFNFDIQKAKQVGSSRANRIREIIQKAASETVSEFKGGAGEVGTIARDAFSQPASTSPTTTSIIVEPADPQVGDIVVAPTTEATAERPVALVIRLFNAIKSRVLTQLRQEYQDLPQQYAEWKKRASDLDARLEARYPERYQTMKQQLRGLNTWYQQVAAQDRAAGTTTLEQKQVAIENRAGAAGTSVAQREQQIRQRIKQFLNTTAEKL